MGYMEKGNVMSDLGFREYFSHLSTSLTNCYRVQEQFDEADTEENNQVDLDDLKAWGEKLLVNCDADVKESILKDFDKNYKDTLRFRAVATTTMMSMEEMD